MKKLTPLTIYLIFLIFSSTTSAVTNIHNVRVASYNPNTTRVVLDVSGEPQYHYFTLANPNRLVIDFIHGKSAVNLEKVKLANSTVKNIRSGTPDAKTFRLVLDITQPVTVSKFLLPFPGDLKRKRLVFDLNHQTVSKSSDNNPPKIIKKPSKIRDVTVVIDAGHGGKDPGAHGQGGTQEKTVVLAIARELSRLINQQPGMHAVMTRDGNYYVPLRTRLQKTRKSKGDIFISIHADAFKNPKSSGASVYALSLKGASSEAARWLAEKENYSELGQVDLKDKDDVLRSVLIDLSQTATIGASLELGERVLDKLKAITKLHHPRVEQARFVVLKSPDIPSILVETGFISNPQEERRLKSLKYQKQLAQAIMSGINLYFRHQAPPGTWLAQHYGQHLEFRA